MYVLRIVIPCLSVFFFPRCFLFVSLRFFFSLLLFTFSFSFPSSYHFSSLSFYTILFSSSFPSLSPNSLLSSSNYLAPPSFSYLSPNSLLFLLLLSLLHTSPLTSYLSSSSPFLSSNLSLSLPYPPSVST